MKKQKSQGEELDSSFLTISLIQDGTSYHNSSVTRVLASNASSCAAEFAVLRTCLKLDLLNDQRFVLMSSIKFPYRVLHGFSALTSLATCNASPSNITR